MNTIESKKKVINKTKNIVSATILVMSVRDDSNNINQIRERAIETSLNLLDFVQSIRTLTPVYKNQFISNSQNQIDSLLDYLHIGYSVGAISRMNADILAKELHNLGQMIAEATNAGASQNDQAHIEIPNSFFDEMSDSESVKVLDKPENKNIQLKDNNYVKDIYKGQTNIKPKELAKPTTSKTKKYVSNTEKRQNRKDIILNYITEKRLKGDNEGVMVKDILTKIKDVSEKTLQRELSVLVAKGVLRKVGEKRWSRYVLAK